MEQSSYSNLQIWIAKSLEFREGRHAPKLCRSCTRANDGGKTSTPSVFSLEKTFKTTFSLLLLHMWLCLRRLKQEGKEGVEFGQYLYEIYNHDVELRVSKAGVNLLLTKWMKELEKIFYGNIVAYDTAILPEAKLGDFSNTIWRNIFSEDGSSTPDDSASQSMQVCSPGSKLHDFNK